MKNTKIQKNEILEAINTLRKRREKVTTAKIAKIIKLSQQWTGHLIKRYELTDQVDSYNGRWVLNLLYRYNKECPPFLTRKELYAASHYKGTFEAFKLILWRHKINYRREQKISMK